jgi:hypothetical protein
MLHYIWVILVLIAASGWALAETTDDVRMTPEYVLQMFDNAQVDEVVFERAKKLLVLRNVQFRKGRVDVVFCDLDRKALTFIMRDHDLQTDDRWGVAAFECEALIELLRARGRLP